MFKVYDLYLLSPELSLVVLALVVMMVDLFVRRRIVMVTVGLVGLLVPIGLLISQYITLDSGSEPRAFFGTLVVDHYSLFFESLALLIAVVMLIASYSYVEKYVKADGEFYTLMLFATAGMMFMASSGELITVYISLELTSIPLYVMAGLIRGSERSAEAAVKYVLLGAMSSAILLYGFALLYGLTGTTDLRSIATELAKGNTLGILDGNYLHLVACVLIIAGFGFKISAVPFHMWAPDIYEGAPTPATAFFSVASKAAGFAALMRVFFSGGLGQDNLTTLVVVFSVVAILTMTLGNFVAAVQTNVKRMMAYSSIAQAGYILIGLTGSLAQNKSDGISTALFFLFIYAITNLGAFSGIIALANLTGGEKIEDFRGLSRRSPYLSACTALCLLSLAGIPPLAGFWSKIYIFTAGWGLQQYVLVIVALLNSIISLVYYGRIVKTMYFDAPVKPDRLVTPRGLTISIGLMSAALIVFFVIPGLLLQFTSPAGASLFQFLK